MAKSPYEETRAVARLPHLDIEILHRRPWEGEGEGEEIRVTMKVTPSFEAFERYFDCLNPLALWSGLMQAAWAPWFGAASAALGVLSPPRED